MIKPGRAPDYRDREYGRRVEPTLREKAVAVRPEPAKTQFEQYERVMHKSFRALCEAVAVIKNKHLYRQAGFDTFAECCEQRWGWTARRGYQLAEANATMKSLPKSVNKLFTNEGQVRAIAAVPKEERAKIVKQVSRTGPVTAKAIQDAVRPPVVIDVEPTPQTKTAEKHCPTCRCVGSDPAAGE